MVAMFAKSRGKTSNDLMEDEDAEQQRHMFAFSGGKTSIFCMETLEDAVRCGKLARDGH